MKTNQNLMDGKQNLPQPAKVISISNQYALLKFMPGLIAFFDEEGQLLHSNIPEEQFKQKFDFGKEKLLQQCLLEKRNIHAVEEVMDSSAGESHLFNQFNYNEEATYRVCFLQSDITPARLINRNIYDRVTRLKEITRIKSQFMSAISHEFRTPIHAIKGLVELLMDQLGDPDHKKKLETIYQSSDHLLSMVNDVLSFNDLENDRVKLSEDVFALYEVLQWVEANIESEINPEKIKFSITVAEHVPLFLYGDSTRLCQILFQLLSNAIKFTPEGAMGLYIQSGTTENGHTHIVFHIGDTGIGIRPNILNEIFYSFNQAETGNNRKFGGLGLGLTLVKKYTELMQGNLSVETEPGQGTVFVLDLPFRRAEIADLYEDFNEWKNAEFFINKKILIIADSTLDLLIYSHFLKFAGCKYQLIETLENCILNYDYTLYNAIVIDLKMPGISGFETATQIRKLCSTPIITIDENRVEDNVNLMAIHQLSRPVSPDLILNTLSKIV